MKGPRIGAAAMAILLSGAAVPAASGKISIDALLMAYEHGDYQVLQRTVTTPAQFEVLRKDLGSEKGGERRGAIARWHALRRPVQPLFMLELALVGCHNAWPDWLDVLEEGRKFVTSRPQPPGANASDDALEIAWHKASIALLQGLRRPDLAQTYGVGRLQSRMVAAPAPGVAALVDPWIALARGVTEEQWMLTRTVSTRARAQVAMSLFGEAAKHPAYRQEALVRKGAVLLTLGRSEEALAALDAAAGDSDDRIVTYWMWLFRGRALDRLDRAAEAEAAYEEAHRLLPDAQAPQVALMALFLRRGEHTRAFEAADAVRTARQESRDPWWQYSTGDFRLLEARIVALRRMVFP